MLPVICKNYKCFNEFMIKYELSRSGCITMIEDYAMKNETSG